MPVADFFLPLLVRMLAPELMVVYIQTTKNTDRMILFITKFVIFTSKNIFENEIFSLVVKKYYSNLRLKLRLDVMIAVVIKVFCTKVPCIIYAKTWRSITFTFA